MFEQSEMLRLARDNTSRRGASNGRSVRHSTMFYDSLVNKHSSRPIHFSGIHTAFSYTFVNIWVRNVFEF